MSEVIRTIDLIDNTVISDRDVTVDVPVVSLDVHKLNGTYAAVESRDSSGGYNGRVVIYPQSPVPQVTSPVILKNFNRVGSLLYPCDAKFDYINGKIWIADTGNDRVLKVDLNTLEADLDIDDLYYAHSLAVDLNTGNVFVKGYETYDRNRGSIWYYKKDGTLLGTFLFNRYDSESSSSSSSGDNGSSSSSSGIYFPYMPSARSMAFDHVRSRLWWVDGNRIYMLDIRNRQVQTYGLLGDSLKDALVVHVEFSTGNAFVIVTNLHGQRLLAQMNRDNTQMIALAYI